jgi:hypothetical protein
LKSPWKWRKWQICNAIEEIADHRFIPHNFCDVLFLVITCIIHSFQDVIIILIRLVTWCCLQNPPPLPHSLSFLAIVSSHYVVPSPFCAILKNHIGLLGYVPYSGYLRISDLPYVFLNWNNLKKSRDSLCQWLVSSTIRNYNSIKDVRCE